MSESAEEFLARADDVLTDWRGSDDAATWSADGGHEHDIYPFGYLAGGSSESWLRADEWRAVVRMDLDHEVFLRAMRDISAGIMQMAASFATGLEPIRIWVDEASAFRPKEDRTSVEGHAARWLRSWRLGDGGWPLEPVAGCLPPLTTRDDGPRVTYTVPLPPRRALRATAAPTTGPTRRLMQDLTW